MPYLDFEWGISNNLFCARTGFIGALVTIYSTQDLNFYGAFVTIYYIKLVLTNKEATI